MCVCKLHGHSCGLDPASSNEGAGDVRLMPGCKEVSKPNKINNTILMSRPSFENDHCHFYRLTRLIHHNFTVPLHVQLS